MIDEIVEKTKSNKGKRNDLTSGSPDPEVSKETNVKLAELAKNNQNGSFKGNQLKKWCLDQAIQTPTKKQT